MKICSKCKKETPISEFHRNKSGKDGRRSACKICISEYHKKQYWENPEEAKAKLKRHSKRYREKFPERKAIRQARRRAYTKNCMFELYEGFALVPEFCPVLGIKMEWGGGRKNKDNTPSIDRINPNRSYTIDNCRWISTRANTFKNNASFDEMVLIGEDGKKLKQSENNT